VRWNLNRHTVMGHVRRSGVPLRVQGITKADLPAVIRLYKEGLSLAAIGERYGVAHTTVRKELMKAGVPRRKPWRRS
jgi:transposase-like protein